MPFPDLRLVGPDREGTIAKTARWERTGGAESDRAVLTMVQFDGAGRIETQRALEAVEALSGLCQSPRAANPQS